ncbi:MAG: type II toxin-antitoxin system death-on-curing family toxin [Trueperaceae bacterium]
MNSPAKEPRWLDKAIAIALHDESLARFGGSPGIRDEGQLESALERPRNLFAYENVTQPPRLAAAYGFGLARNPPFVDGNKRTAVLLVAVFAALNGLNFDPDQVDEVHTIVALAAGEVTEKALATWIENNSR